MYEYRSRAHLFSGIGMGLLTLVLRTVTSPLRWLRRREGSIEKYSFLWHCAYDTVVVVSWSCLPGVFFERMMKVSTALAPSHDDVHDGVTPPERSTLYELVCDVNTRKKLYACRVVKRHEHSSWDYWAHDGGSDGVGSFHEGWLSTWVKVFSMGRCAVLFTCTPAPFFVRHVLDALVGELPCPLHEKLVVVTGVHPTADLHFQCFCMMYCWLHRENALSDADRKAPRLVSSLFLFVSFLHSYFIFLSPCFSISFFSISCFLYFFSPSPFSRIFLFVVTHFIFTLFCSWYHSSFFSFFFTFFFCFRLRICFCHKIGKSLVNVV